MYFLPRPWSSRQVAALFLFGCLMGNLEDGGTQGGHLVVIGNPEMGDRGAIVTWQSHKLKQIVKSTLAAETMACLDGIDRVFILEKILKELTGSQIPETALVDNKSLIESVKSTKTVQEKRLRVDIGSLKQLTSDQNDPLIMKWIPSYLQLADILTKQRANCGKNLQNLVRNGQFMFLFISIFFYIDDPSNCFCHNSFMFQILSQ